MIYAIGIDSDRTFRHFLERSAGFGVAVRPINLRAVIRGSWHLAIPDSGTSWVEQDGERVELDPAASYYCRVIDLSSAQVDHAEAVRWRNLAVAVNSWLEHVSGIVINRPGTMMGDNSTKPLHEVHLANLGMKIPPSITSSSRDELRGFARAQRSIVKTISGVRANTRLVTPEDFADFDPRQGPVHLQAYVAGGDIRAHVIGSQVHAERIQSEEVDYRQSGEAMRSAKPHQLTQAVQDLLVAATSQMGLMFAGWDFKVVGEDELWCLEANPMPGYDGYDKRLNGAVTKSLLTQLGARVQ